MTLLSEKHRLSVIRELYKQADEMRWDNMGPADKTRQYNAWLDDPNIGGVLLRYMSRERARVWLKDGPMKERNRAINGRGSNANLVPRRASGPEVIAQAALGPGWEPVPDTMLDKPSRCLVSSEAGRRLMIWGPQKSFRDLVFAAVVAKSEGLPNPFIVVASRPGQEPDLAEKGRHKSIGSVAAVEVFHVTERLVSASSTKQRS